MLSKSSAFVVIALAVACVSAKPQLVNDKENVNIINLINDIDAEKSLYLFGGLSVEKVSGASGGRSFASDVADLQQTVQSYLETHELKFDAAANNVDEARSSRLKKIMLPLLLILKLKMAIILPIILTLLTFISLKGLKAGLLALLFSGATFLKDFFNKKQERVTTAYISGAPVNAEIVHHADWNRNGQATAQDFAYNGYNYQQLPQ